MSELSTCEIFDLATEVRKDFEKRSIGRQLLADLYLEYNPSVESDDLTIYDFVDRAIELFPNLNCGLSSVYLRNRLGIGEVVAGTYAGVKHTVLELPELIVVRSFADITADQFEGGPSVYVGPARQPWQI